MPNWISITTATLYEARVAALVDACSGAAKATGQADRAAGLIQGVVDLVRRKVGSNPDNTVDSDETTIPKGLRDLTVDLIIFRLKGAIEEPLSEDEQKLRGEHERTLNRVADGKDKVDQPDVPATPEVNSGGKIAQVGTTTRQVTRTTMRGL